MRERIARWVATVTVLGLVGLAVAFARGRNPPEAVAAAPEPQAPAAEVPAQEAPAPELLVAEAPAVGEPGVEAVEAVESPAPAATPTVTEAPAPPAPTAAVSPPLATAADSLRGRAVYERHGCARCHSVAGQGSPRYPLDGVGRRRTRPQLHDWTVGAEVLADSLPPSAFRTKQAFADIPAADLEDLIHFLASLQAGAPGT